MRKHLLTDEQKEIIYVNPYEFYTLLLSETEELNVMDKSILVSLDDDSIIEAFTPSLSNLANGYDILLYSQISEEVLSKIKADHPILNFSRIIYYREISDAHSIAITTKGFSEYKDDRCREIYWTQISAVDYNHESKCFEFYDKPDFHPLKISKYDLITCNEDIGVILLAFQSMIASIGCRNMIVEKFVENCTFDVSELGPDGIDSTGKVHWNNLSEMLERFFGIQVKKVDYENFGTKRKIRLSYLVYNTRRLIYKYQVQRIVNSYLNIDVLSDEALSVDNLDFGKLIGVLNQVYNLKMDRWQFESLQDMNAQVSSSQIVELIATKLMFQPQGSDVNLLYSKELNKIC